VRPLDDAVYATFSSSNHLVMTNRSREDVSANSTRLAMLAAVVLVSVLAGTVSFVSRKWVAQHANVVLPVLGIGCAGVLLAGVLVLPFVQEMREDARRVEAAQRLRAMGEAFHQRSSHSGGTRGGSSVPQPVAIHDDSAAGADTPIAASESTVTSTGTETPAAAPDPPEWARGETVDFRELRQGVYQNPVVLVSDEWACVQESEIPLEAMAARALQQQLRMQRGSSFKWRPSTDFIHQSGAIQQRYVEQTSLKLRDSEAPMFRSYWRVGATPHVSSLAYEQWKSSEIEERLTMLGGGAALLTLVFAGGAAGLRFDSATGGKYRRHMFAAAGFVTSMGAAMLLFA
jgi:hypothetical protein